MTEFRILGPLEVREGDEVLRLGGAKERSLLSILLLDANRAVSTDRLVDELWADSPPASAVHAVQVYVSKLRRQLGDRLVTQPPGYLIRVEQAELDLDRFEATVAEARSVRAHDPERASVLLAGALALWRGPPLADLVYESFAQAAVARLDELRLVALEERVEADLACGRHAELVGELQALAREHPLRERPRGQLMVALYRCGRQAEALEVFQETRKALVEQLAIEPSPALQRLERAILQQDAELELGPRATPSAESPQRSILLASLGERALTGLLDLVEPLGRTSPSHGLILVRPVSGQDELSAATAQLNELRAEAASRWPAVRATAFTSRDPGSDLVRIASEQDVDLLVLPGSEATRGGGELAEELEAALEAAPCDVALVFDRVDVPSRQAQAPVLVPFGGAEHDWAALELGAWWARALGVGLRLLGTHGEEEGGPRDASRLLAHAALAVQQLAGVTTEPVLSPPGGGGLLQAQESSSLVVAGFAETWRQDGLGSTRAAVAARSSCPAVFVRRGLRPGGLAPGESLTRYSWSLSGVPP